VRFIALGPSGEPWSGILANNRHVKDPSKSGILSPDGADKHARFVSLHGTMERICRCAPRRISPHRQNGMRIRRAMRPFAGLLLGDDSEKAVYVVIRTSGKEQLVSFTVVRIACPKCQTPKSINADDFASLVP
jgi:hypothetical protein